MRNKGAAESIETEAAKFRLQISINDLGICVCRLRLGVRCRGTLLVGDLVVTQGTGEDFSLTKVEYLPPKSGPMVSEKVDYLRGGRIDEKRKAADVDLPRELRLSLREMQDRRVEDREIGLDRGVLLLLRLPTAI